MGEEQRGSAGFGFSDAMKRDQNSDAAPVDARGHFLLCNFCYVTRKQLVYSIIMLFPTQMLFNFSFSSSTLRKMNLCFKF